MIIGIYAKLRQGQNSFLKTTDPKICIKKIKEKDLYISYIAYAEYNTLMDPNYNINEILSELIAKYPTKIEAYLKYWGLLTKGPKRDYKLCLKLSEMFWRNSSMIHFDNNIY